MAYPAPLALALKQGCDNALVIHAVISRMSIDDDNERMVPQLEAITCVCLPRHEKIDRAATMLRNGWYNPRWFQVQTYGGDSHARSGEEVPFSLDLSTVIIYKFEKLKS